jgi:L-aminopeptidase/D-esterase-like protein
VVNAAGSVIDPEMGLPWELDGRTLRRPIRTELSALRAALAPRATPLNTTIGVVATSAALTKAECTKFASVTHDGMARAVRPAHSMFDGDTVFALATGAPATADLSVGSRKRAIAMNRILEAGAQCFAAACTAAVVEAQSHRNGPPAYRDLCPSVFPSAT